MSRSIRSTRVAFVAVLSISSPWLAVNASEAGARAERPAVPAPPDACALLTKEAAAAALGEAAKGPKALTNLSAGLGATVSSCEYTGSGDHRVQLILTRLAASAVPMYRDMCAEKSTKDLAGIGEVACWGSDKHEDLNVLKGTVLLSLELRRSGDPTAPIKAAMRKALTLL